LRVASQSDSLASTHCFHAGPTGTGSDGTVTCGSPCDAYCAVVQAACPSGTSTLAQFASTAACLTACANYPHDVSAMVVTSGNSLECRAYHGAVALAAGGSTLHCPHAGPTGGGTVYCGSFCESYCTQIMVSCPITGTNLQYTSYAECVAVCAAFPQDGVVTPLAVDGDSVQCRHYHALVAADTPDPHCTHAGPTGGGTCGSVCAAYCDVIQAACGTSGTNSQFADTATCLTACATYATTGTFRDSTGNTLQCRMYHAGVAQAGTTDDKTLHCPHAGQTSTSTYCGSGSMTGTSMTSTTGSMTGTGTVSGAAVVQASFALIASIAAALLIAKQL